MATHRPPVSERLYTEHADVYDALYRATEDHDTAVDFLRDRLAARGDPARYPDAGRALVLGCGPGEHARRLADAGFTVTALDPSEAMVERAREKSPAEPVTVRVGALPDVPVTGRFELVVAPFTVINHLPPDAVRPALETMAGHLAAGGVLALDNGWFDAVGEEPVGPRLQVVDTELGDVARLLQVRAVSANGPADADDGPATGRVRWESVVLVQDRQEWFLDTHELTAIEDAVLEAHLAELGLVVETHAGYGTGGPETVFVCTRGQP